MENACVFSSVSYNMGKDSQTHRMGKSWEIGLHTFSIKWVGFFIRSPFCRILQHMENAWAFSSVSHSMEKDRKTDRMGKAWEIGSRENLAKPIVC